MPERYTDEAVERLAAAIRERMDVLAMSQSELVRASGVSAATVRKIMAGVSGNYQQHILGKISLALGWTPTSSTRILGGQLPSLAPQSGSVVIERPEHPTVYLQRGDFSAWTTEFVQEVLEAGGLAGLDRLEAQMNEAIRQIRELQATDKSRVTPVDKAREVRERREAELDAAEGAADEPAERRGGGRRG